MNVKGMKGGPFWHNKRRNIQQWNRPKELEKEAQKVPDMRLYLTWEFKKCDVEGVGILAYNDFWDMITASRFCLSDEHVFKLKKELDLDEVKWGECVGPAGIPTLLQQIRVAGEKRGDPLEWCELPACVEGDDTTLHPTKTYWYNRKSTATQWSRPEIVETYESRVPTLIRCLEERYADADVEEEDEFPQVRTWTVTDH